VPLSGLKKSLADLSEFSTATMRRLDDTYFAVLEKMSVLQTTILGLKELAIMSQNVNKTLKKESHGVVEEVTDQLDTFGNFESHERRIENLQGRIQVGRAKIKTLSERVDVVRQRVEGWERADRDWQERTRKRMKAIWIVISCVFFAMLLLYVSAQYTSPILQASSPSDYITPSSGLNITNSGATDSRELMNDTADNADNADTADTAVPRLWKEKREATEDRLHIFDEL
jgi:hypothetical protein